MHRKPSWVIQAEREVKKYTETPKPGAASKNMVQPHPEMDPLYELIEKFIEEKKLNLNAEEKQKAINMLRNLMPKELDLKAIGNHQKKMIGLAFIAILAKKPELSKAILHHVLTPENQLTEAQKKIFGLTAIALIFDKQALANSLLKIKSMPIDELNNAFQLKFGKEKNFLDKMNDLENDLMNFIKVFGHSKSGLDVTVHPDITDAIGAVEENINIHEVKSLLDEVATVGIEGSPNVKGPTDLEKALAELANPFDAVDKANEIEKQNQEQTRYSTTPRMTPPGFPKG